MSLDGEPPLTLEPRDPRPPRQHVGRKALLGGVAIACVLGVGLGLAARSRPMEIPARRPGVTLAPFNSPSGS